MSGSISSPSSLMSTQIIDNTTGQIKAANFRNVIETLAGSPSSGQTTNYAVAAGDRGTTVKMNSATAVNVTINNGVLTAGQIVGVRQVGAGAVTIQPGAGVSSLSSSNTTRAQGSLIWVTMDTATTFWVDGDTA